MITDPILDLIADIRNRTLSARYVYKRLRDKKINEIQAMIDLGKELDKIDQVLIEYDKSSGVRPKEDIK